MKIKRAARAREAMVVEKLLVPVKKHDLIEKLTPCLDVLVRPNMTVIFLFQYPVDSGSYFRDHRINVESVRQATAVGRTIAQRYTWEAQKERARQIIAPAVKALEARGVRAEVHLCSGRWAQAINKYSLDQEIRWIVTQPPRPVLTGYWSANTLVPSGWSGCLLSVRPGPDFFQKERQRGHSSTKNWHSGLIDCSVGEVLQEAYKGKDNDN
jgi:hypothetical protein